MDYIATQEVGGYTVGVLYDSIPESPRTAHCNPGRFFTALKRHTSPDAYSGGLFDAVADALGMEPVDDDAGMLVAALDGTEHIVLPVYMYDHGGVAYRAGTAGQNPFLGTTPHADWDSGMAGFICMSADEIRETYGVSRITDEIRTCARESLIADVETYSSWANGEVYGFVVTGPDGDDVESCFGYYGDPDMALADGVAEAEGCVRADRLQATARLKRLIRNRVPLHLREALVAAPA